MPESVLLLVGRVLMALLFVAAAFPMLKREAGQRKVIRSVGIPAASFLQPLAGLCLLVGSLMLALGVWARVAAALLALFVVAITPLFHRFWSADDPQQRMQMTQAFLANVAIVGGLLAFWAIGPGPLAIFPSQ